MTNKDRADYDKMVDDMLEKRWKMGLPFAIFALVAILGLIGVYVYFAFN